MGSKSTRFYIFLIDFQHLIKIPWNYHQKAGYLRRRTVLSVTQTTNQTTNNKMKKIVSFFVAATFAVALTSCGSKPAETTETETAVEAPAAEPAAEPAADMAASTETAPADAAAGTPTM